MTEQEWRRMKNVFFGLSKTLSFPYKIFLTNHLNVHIIRGEHFESNVEEAVISSIHKD